MLTPSFFRSFRFSLGFSSLVKRFLTSDPRKRRGVGGSSPHHHHQQYQGGVPRGLGPLTPDTPSNEFSFLPPDDWSLVSKIAIASLSSQVNYVSFCTKCFSACDRKRGRPRNTVSYNNRWQQWCRPVQLMRIRVQYLNRYLPFWIQTKMIQI